MEISISRPHLTMYTFSKPIRKITAASSEGNMEQISLFDSMPNDV